MRPQDFSGLAPGRLVKIDAGITGEEYAFLPNALPPTLDLGSLALRQALSVADQALARLDGCARLIERPDILFEPYLRREALLSSKIEGTHTTEARLALYEAAGASSEGSNDTEDVANYVRAFEYGRARCEELPIGTRLFCELHAILMQSADHDRVTPGLLRDCVVVIGKPQVRFVPPPYEFVQELLENLQVYLADDPEPMLIKLAIAHYQFEAIHPFRDGNGRIGRLMISLALQRAKMLTVPMLYLSAYFEQHQQAYYDAMLRVSTQNSWVEWILFFLDGVSTQASDASDRANKLAALRKSYHDRLRGPRVTQGPFLLVDELFKRPVMSVPMAAEHLKISYQSAKDSVNKLVRAEILMSTEVYNGTKFWFADELMQTVNR